MNRLRGRWQADPGSEIQSSLVPAPTGPTVLRTLSMQGPRLAIDLALDTLDAHWYRDGERSLLVLGLRADAWGLRSAAEADELVRMLASDAPAALLRLQGTWVLLFADGVADRCLLATNRAGTRSPCYAVRNRQLAFGLTALDVVAADRELGHLRPQAIFDYLHAHFIPAPETVFGGVERLLPGEYIELARGVASRRRYWEPHYAKSGAGFDFATSKSTFRRLLERSVRAEVDTGTTGAFLSGGTDSSTVAGMLGLVTGEPARTYSIGFDAAGFDEMGYARIAARHFGTRHHEYYVTPADLVHSIPIVAAAYDQPFGNSSALPAYYCAQLAREDGVERILGGDGGDELFGGNTRYARQKVFDAYRHVPGWLRSGVVEPLLLGPAATRRIPLVRKARSYVEQARVPMPSRLHTYNLLERIGLDTILTRGFLAAVDARAMAASEAAEYARCTADSLVDRMLCLDWKYTLADNDLPKVVGTCDLAGVGVGFPLLNEDLTDFANALPAREKVKGLKLRHFFKAALRDFLPAKIIAKQKHGFGLPFGPWLVKDAALRGLATRTLESLRTRGIVRAEFIDELLAQRVHEHAAYYGELVWVMMMLELWLQAHRPDFTLAGP
jgi:asparagine synthase (glutamine-hydrolysing)